MIDTITCLERKLKHRYVNDYDLKTDYNTYYYTCKEASKCVNDYVHVQNLILKNHTGKLTETRIIRAFRRGRSILIIIMGSIIVQEQISQQQICVAFKGEPCAPLYLGDRLTTCA